MNLTREEAEAKGWTFSIRQLPGEIKFCDCMARKSDLRIVSTDEETGRAAIESLLPVIDRLERYAEAERMLEELEKENEILSSIAVKLCNIAERNFPRDLLDQLTGEASQAFDDHCERLAKLEDRR